MVKNFLKAPGGMRSYLPEMVCQLNEIKDRIFNVFNLWGYRPIITPTLEYYDALATGMGNGQKKELYKFIDYEGNILALRPEMTAPIARTLAGRFDELNLPERFSYEASVFRYDQPQAGKNREIFQTGVELIGEQNTMADAEAIILAIEALAATGIKGFKVDIGHAGYLEGVINQLGLVKGQKERLKNFLIRRDLVGLRTYLESLGIDSEETIFKLPLLRGGKEVLKKALGLTSNPQALKAITNLEEVEEYLTGYGLADYINFDLGLVRGFDYYTGVVFEAFTDKLGYTICGGGRYDNLIGQYSGNNLPAIGFAIGIERVRIALEKEGYKFNNKKPELAIIFDNKSRNKAMMTSARLRKKGIVTVIFKGSSITERYIELCNNKGIDKIISFHPWPETEEIEVFIGESKITKRILLEEGWEERIWAK